MVTTPYVFKDHHHRWFARMPKRTPAQARKAIRTALLARGVIDLDEEVRAVYVEREGITSYLYKSSRTYRPGQVRRNGSRFKAAGETPEVGDVVRIIADGTGAGGSAHRLPVGNVGVVYYYTPRGRSVYENRTYINAMGRRGNVTSAFAYDHEWEYASVDDLSDEVREFTRVNYPDISV